MSMTGSPTLDRIRAAGVLRVGTTGDYTPFSLRRRDGSYEGADIDMAHDLSATIGVGLEFVATVWVDLLDDFLEDRDRFTSIAAIDQSGVRVIANPGSANEAFARANFTHAHVTIHHDNASVFTDIVAGRADVMVTDGLEADHQAELHPELCAVPVA